MDVPPTGGQVDRLWARTRRAMAQLHGMRPCSVLARRLATLAVGAAGADGLVPTVAYGGAAVLAGMSASAHIALGAVRRVVDDDLDLHGRLVRCVERRRLV